MTGYLAVDLIYFNNLAGFFEPSLVTDLLAFALISLSLLLIPLSIAFAILRSKLWDIDIIINRTLVYASLTGILATVYVSSILLLQYILEAVIHQNDEFAIVISTLLIAALFQPLRHRVQQIIDHRFYRRKYDAARTLAGFSNIIRNEVDLATLSEQLVSVVEETMQPTSVSLWLCEEGQGSGES